MVKKKEWICVKCTYVNVGWRNDCEVCGCSDSKLKNETQNSSVPKASTEANSFTLIQNNLKCVQDEITDQWGCSKCNFRNIKRAEICEVCGNKQN